MLKLKNVKKDYIVGDSKVNALKGVDLCFRQNEFVSILGPSGCGKTTLLNIIGGLDHYTEGDMFIDEISTKNYTDRDWDTYRNHRIGFVFQSYNLIPHQTILENVELALTISGIEKSERIKRAKEALDKVGLKDQYNKKPNQLSGGQCQRVAIARALVNEPEILLADEPTGALDTVTSKQIMDLIREIAKDCLVIMVTHNPEIAQEYSNRIIKLLDGKVLSDSNPFDGKTEENSTATAKKKRKNITKKSKLSFWTAFKLSARNLKSKLKRTLLVCLAGSIGIIGVASVLSVSTGIKNYIADMQNDMLSGNPITVSTEDMDLTALMANSQNFSPSQAIKDSVENGYVNVDFFIEYLIKQSDNVTSARIHNDITPTYVNYIKEMPKEYYAALSFSYGINASNNIYTDFSFKGQNKNIMSLSAAKTVYTNMLSKTEYKGYSTYINALSDTFAQMPNNPDFILSQYDVVSNPETSKIPTEEDEIMIVLSKENELTDLLFAQLGYFSQDEFFNIIYKAVEDDKYDQSLLKERFSYDELLNKTFTWYPNDTVYNTQTNPILAEINPFTYNAYQDESWNTGKQLKITAILAPKEDLSYGCLSSGFYYTEAFAQSVLQDSKNSQIVNYFKEKNITSFSSTAVGGINKGITYTYSFNVNSTQYDDQVGFVGSVSQIKSMMGSMLGQSIPSYYTISLSELGGIDLPFTINIYPFDFEYKDEVTNYLDKWNDNVTLTVNGQTVLAEDRSNVTYSDNLELVINLVNDLIQIITSALVAFTSLSLVVSTVMIAIITYVSVIERVKEIGVIRSLGGRKNDVSNLFNAETFIIGSISGVIGIAITYLLSAIINIIVGNLSGIYTIATLPVSTALIMIGISIALTLISGLIPARLAAKKDPVDALRTE